VFDKQGKGNIRVRFKEINKSLMWMGYVKGCLDTTCVQHTIWSENQKVEWTDTACQLLTAICRKGQAAWD